jgi:hypothetical protein
MVLLYPKWKNYVLFYIWNLICWPRRQKHQDKFFYQIYISGKSYENLSVLILPYLIPEMLYKFPIKRSIRSRFI